MRNRSHGRSQFGEAGHIRGDASRVERDPIGPRLDVGVRHERQARLPSTCIRAQSAGVSEGTGSVRQHRAAGCEPRNASRIGVTRTGPRRGSRSSGRTTLFPTQAFARGARGVLRAHLRRRRPLVQAGLRPGPLNAPTAEQCRGHAVERGRLVQADKRARVQPMSTDTVPTVDHDHADVRMVDQRVRERHPLRARADHQIVGLQNPTRARAQPRPRTGSTAPRLRSSAAPDRSDNDPNQRARTSTHRLVRGMCGRSCDGG
jgi:hypothetical protein